MTEPLLVSSGHVIVGVAVASRDEDDAGDAGDDRKHAQDLEPFDAEEDAGAEGPEARGARQDCDRRDGGVLERGVDRPAARSCERCRGEVRRTGELGQEPKPDEEA